MAEPIAQIAPEPKPLDFSDFDGPRLNTAWKPGAQDLIYTAINHVRGDYEDADEDCALQIIERLVELVSTYQVIRYTITPGLFGSWRVVENKPMRRERSTWQTQADAQAEADRLNETSN